MPPAAPEPAAALLAQWNLPPTAALRPAPAGSNNVSWFVHPGDSQSPAAFVLRIHQNPFTRESLLWEHQLLLRLAGEGLSFAVPAPAAAAGGTTLVPAPGLGPQGADVWASLCPFLPGSHPPDDGAPVLRPLGAALGELMVAMGRVTPGLPVRGVTSYGDLDRMHRLVPDPYDLPAELGLDDAETAAMQRAVRTAWEAAPALYTALPRQVIHSDYVPSNVLMHGDRVTAILDFEFAAHDLRAMDVAVALFHLGRAPWRERGEWGHVEAIARGLAEHVRLHPDEVAALPILLRLRPIAVVLHWIGRWKQGAGPIQYSRAGARLTLQLDAWLTHHASELVDRVSASFNL